MADTNQPTLLVFTLGPGREQARKRWFKGRFESLERELHQRCLERVLEAGRAVGCRLRVSSPGGVPLVPDAVSDRQAEDGFRCRLLGAIRRADDESQGPLIVVGTDSPQLDADILRRTREALAENPDEVVLGPAADGGVYLLAAARSVVAELANVRWRSRHTCRSLIAALRAAGRPVRLLSPLEDLDSRRDLERWLATDRSATAGWNSLLAALRGAMRELAALPSRVEFTVPEPAWCRVPVGRAPPR